MANPVRVTRSAVLAALALYPLAALADPAGSGGAIPDGSARTLFAASRESLFGEPAPASRDELFAEEKAEAAGARITGFVNGLAAYTYANPKHWSRAVGRLQLTGQGDLGGGVKWKLSGRVDADPVYFRSHFYPEEVKRDQRVDFFYRENYVDFSAGDWDFRIGTQNIVWGEVIGLFFADVVSARDLREFLLPGFDIIRIPQGAARAEYTRGDAHLELIWIPVPAFDMIGKPGSDFYPVPLPSPLPENVAKAFRDPARPAQNLGHSNFGVRLNTLVSGWDVAAFFYRSFSTMPTFYRLPGESADQPFVFEPRYDRISQTGATFSKDVGEFVLRGEAVYTRGQHYARSDLAASPSEIGRQRIDYIVSAEWSLPGETRLNVQAFQRHYFGGADGIAVSNEGVGGSVYVSKKMGAFEPQFLWIGNFRDGGNLARPRLNWTVSRNVLLAFGLDIFSGRTDSFFGRYNNRDRVYGEVRLDF